MDDNFIAFMLGYLVVGIIFVPLALMDLQENANWQIMAFVVLLVNSLQFVIQFLMIGEEDFVEKMGGGLIGGLTDCPEYNLHESSPLLWWGTSWDALFGVVLFNFFLVIAIPAWLGERHPTVDVPTIVFGSSFLSTCLYILIGMLGAMAIPHVSNNMLESMLESMLSDVFGPTIQIGASVFAFMIVGLGILLFSVLTQMNLTGGDSVDNNKGGGLRCSNNGGMTNRMTNVLTVYLPWSIRWLLGL